MYHNVYMYVIEKKGIALFMYIISVSVVFSFIIVIMT